MAINGEIIAQIDAVSSRFQALRSRARYDDLSDLENPVAVTSILTLICDTVRRFAPPESQYVQSVKELIKQYGPNSGNAATYAAGVLIALGEAYRGGYLTRFAEFVHAELFSDFIEMAEYLLGEGYKDPAAVIVGSVLEEHLRQLCAKNDIAVAANGKPKKADQLNADLASHQVYTKLDQKSVTGWLDLRNKAAHGKYGEYTKEQVGILLTSVQDFMARVPA
jgi:hypothetical protein